MIIRKALQKDIEAMVLLSYEKRRAYEQAQPQFWKYAEDAETIQNQYFKELLTQNDFILLVAELENKIIGFVIGHILKAPAVYNPPGLTLMIDDFCVLSDLEWTSTGGKLLDELKKISGSFGAKQILCVCGAHDEPKRQFLKSANLNITSEWYVGSF
jgi:ribosomal protein S18 acetylase RimI-like enzyme